VTTMIGIKRLHTSIQSEQRIGARYQAAEWMSHSRVYMSYADAQCAKGNMSWQLDMIAMAGLSCKRAIGERTSSSLALIVSEGAVRHSRRHQAGGCPLSAKALSRPA
jgi:hypothetical protein